MSELLLDAAGRRRFSATLPEFHAGRPPRNKGMRYPADPPTIEEIVTVMRPRRRRRPRPPPARPDRRVVARRPTHPPALALAEADLDARRGSLLVRRGKGGRRREVGIDDSAWEPPEPWLPARFELPVGPLFASSTAPRADGRGRPTPPAAELRRVARRAGVRRRFRRTSSAAPPPSMARGGVPLIIIQRQLGTPDLGITSVYLQGIDDTVVVTRSTSRRAPMVPSTARCPPKGSTRPAAGNRTSSPAVLIQITSQDPVATGSQSAKFIPRERRTRRKRPAPITEGAFTQRPG